MKLNLKDKVIVITGASQGIGAATAKEFAKYGSKVVLVARSLDLLEDAAKEVRNLGGEAYVVKTDVSKISEIKELAKKTLAKYKRIDIWVNNAGFGIASDAVSAKEEYVNQIFSVNLLAVYWGMRIAAEAMKKNKTNPRGVIVNVSSIMSELPIIPGVTLYQATKRGVDDLSEGIGLELLSLNIAIIDVKPGLTASNFQKNTLGKGYGLPHGMRGIDPEVVARKIVREVMKGKSNRRVIVTWPDRVMIVIFKLLDFPIRFLIRLYAKRRKIKA